MIKSDIHNALTLIQEWCFNEIEKKRDLNIPEDYVAHRILSEGISTIFGLQTYISFPTSESKEVPENKTIIRNNKGMNITIN